MAEKDLTARQALYEKSRAAGAPVAQIYAEMLQLNGENSPFNAITDHNMEWPGGHAAHRLQAQHDYLQDLIGR